MKTYVFGGLAAAAVLAAVFVTSNFVSRNARAFLHLSGDRVERSMPDEMVESVIKTKLSDFDAQIASYHVSLGRLTDKVAAADADLADGDKKLDSETALLRKSKGMLDQKNKVEYVISGRVYDREQVAADAQTRLARCQQLEAQLEAKKKLHAALKVAVKEGKDNLTKAKKMRQELVLELDGLKARLATARAREEVNQIAAAMKDLPTGLDSDLARALAEMKDRAATAEHKADYLANDAKGGNVVDWSNADTEDVSRAIGQYLGGGSGPASIGAVAPSAKVKR